MNTMTGSDQTTRLPAAAGIQGVTAPRTRKGGEEADFALGFAPSGRRIAFVSHRSALLNDMSKRSQGPRKSTLLGKAYTFGMAPCPTRHPLALGRGGFTMR